MTSRTVAVLAAAAFTAACSQQPEGSMRELQRTRAGGLEVVLLAPSDTLKQGEGFAILEFRESSGALVNVGTVKVSATMPHPGAEPMLGTSEVKTTPAPGRYEISTNFSMAGGWFLSLEWDGPHGHGEARLPATVQ